MKKRFWKLVGGFFLFMVIIGFIAGCGDDSAEEEPVENQQAEVQETNSTSPEEKLAENQQEERKQRKNPIMKQHSSIFFQIATADIFLKKRLEI